nr:hypothetical protein [Aneurinibacillus sp. XH2]
MSTLNGVIDVWSLAYACKNPSRLHMGVSYKSAEAEMLSMKHSSYGYDVLALAASCDSSII